LKIVSTPWKNLDLISKSPTEIKWQKLLCKVNFFRQIFHLQNTKEKFGGKKIFCKRVNFTLQRSEVQIKSYEGLSEILKPLNSVSTSLHIYFHYSPKIVGPLSTHINS
jgi:hypothetical protein